MSKEHMSYIQQLEEEIKDVIDCESKYEEFLDFCIDSMRLDENYIKDYKDKDGE